MPGLSRHEQYGSEFFTAADFDAATGEIGRLGEERAAVLKHIDLLDTKIAYEESIINGAARRQRDLAHRQARADPMGEYRAEACAGQHGVSAEFWGVYNSMMRSEADALSSRVLEVADHTASLAESYHTDELAYYAQQREEALGALAELHQRACKLNRQLVRPILKAEMHALRLAEIEAAALENKRTWRGPDAPAPRAPSLQELLETCPHAAVECGGLAVSTVSQMARRAVCGAAASLATECGMEHFLLSDSLRQTGRIPGA